MVRVAVIVLSLLLSASVYAGPNTYLCSVLHTKVLDESGGLADDDYFSDIDPRFTVDRQTGQVTGGLLDNSGMDISLYDSGSTEMSFKVTAVTTSPVKHAMYLQINEVVEGNAKPFIGIRSPNSVLLTGLCE